MSATAVRPPGHLPRTFLEWGVAVPFTTPLLSSGRVRPGRRGRPEMLMPNPSGGRGLYVFDLAAAPEVASLTLHDRLLVERLLELPAPSPSEIRKVAHEVAIEGAAGRRAAREASAAAEADVTIGLLTRFHLVTRLLEEAGLESIDWRNFGGGDRELRTMIRDHLTKVAPRLGAPVDQLFEQIEEIGEVATPVGPPIEGSNARNDLMLGRLRTLIVSLRQWSAGDTESAAADAAAVLGAADRTVKEASEAQQQARDLLGGVMDLLKGWHQRAGEQLRTTFTRPEWLLDGWGQVCGLWESAARDERPAQRETLQLIRQSLPMLDPGDRSGAGVAAATSDIRFDRGRRVRLHEDWRTGLTVLENRARSELLRAATA
ncbi:MAG: hypothetical protein ACJ8C8_08700 [Microvirga sp.]